MIITKKKKKELEEIQKNVEKNKESKNTSEQGGWVKSAQKGKEIKELWSDGYDVGDISKTILKAKAIELNTVADATTNIWKGFLTGAEGIVDSARYTIADASKKSANWQAKMWEKAGYKDYAQSLRKSGQQIYDYEKSNATMNVTGALLGETNDIFKENWSKKIDENSVLDSKADSVAQGIGQVGFNIGAGYLTGGSNLSTFGTTFASAYGNARSEAYNNGADDKTAKTTGLISGFSEAISEQIFSGIPGLKTAGWGDKVTGKIGKSVSKYFGSSAGKAAIKVLDAAGEGSEEIISNVLTSIGNNIAHNINEKYTYGMENQSGNILEDIKTELTSQESWDAFISAALTSAITNGGVDIVNNTRNNSAIKSYAKENNITTEQAKQLFNEVAQKSANQEVTSNYKEQVELEEQLKNRLAANIKEDIKTGNNKINLEDMKNAFLSKENFMKSVGTKYKENNKEVYKTSSEGLNLVDSYRAYNGNENKISEINNIQKYMEGRNIDSRFDATMFESEKQNALWQTKDGKSTVIFNPNATQEQIIEEIATHEMTHDIINQKTETGTNLFNDVLEYAKTTENYENIRKDLEKSYSKYYDTASKDFSQKIDEEIVANTLGKQLGTQEYINRIVNNNPNIAQKIYRWVVDKLQTSNTIKDSDNNVTGFKSERLYWEGVKNRFEKAYNEANNSNMDNDAKKYHLSKNAFKEIQDALNNINSDINSMVKLRDFTPEQLVSVGVNDLPMLVRKGHLRENILTSSEAENMGYSTKGKHYHGLGIDTYVKAIDSLDNPIAVYQYTDKGKYSTDNFIVLTEIKDSDNNNIIVPIEIHKKGQYNNVEIDVNRVKTTYGKNNPNYFNNMIKTGDLVEVYNKKRSTKLPIQSGNFSTSDINNISQTDTKVNSDTSSNKYSMQKDENDTRYGLFIKRKNQEEINYNISDGLVKEIDYKTKEANKNNKSVKYIDTDAVYDLINRKGERTYDEQKGLFEYIKQRGIKEPIRITNKNGEYEIVDGNHRVEISHNIGLEKVPVVYDNFFGDIDFKNEIWYNQVEERYHEKRNVKIDEKNKNESIDHNRSDEIGKYSGENGKSDKIYQILSRNNNGSSTEAIYSDNAIRRTGPNVEDGNFKYSLNSREELDNSSFSLEQRVTGDELLDAQDLIEEIKSVGANVDKNGYVTLYHQTTNENADKIKQSGKMIAKEPYVYFSTSKDASQSDGRGNTKLEFKIPAEKLILDDIFEDNADVKVKLDNSKELDISSYLVNGNNNLDFSQQIDKVIEGTYPKNDMLVVLDNTPEVLRNIGLNNYPITLTQRHLNTIMNEKGNYKNANYHNLGAELVKKIPEALSKPLNVLQSDTDSNSIVVITNLADSHDRPIIASIRIDGKGNINNVEIDSNVMTSAYGRNNYDQFMQRNIKKGNLLYDIDEGIIKRIGGKLQLRPTSSTDNNVPQSNLKVNSDTLSSTTKYSMQEEENNADYYNSRNSLASNNNDLIPLKGTKTKMSELFNKDLAPIREDIKAVSKQMDNLSKQIETLQNQAENSSININNTFSNNNFSRYVENSINDKQSKGKSYLGKVKETTVNKIKNILGIDVSGRNHVLSSYDIRHMINEHGDAKTEAQKGQIAITSEDIKNIPDILENYDEIIKGSQNALGDTIRYIKKYENNTTYVVEVVPDNSNALIIKTMWKKPSTLTNSIATPSSTALPIGSDISSTSNDNIIRQNLIDVNDIAPVRKVLNPAEIASLRVEDANTTPELQKKKYEKGDKKSKFYGNVTEKTQMLPETARTLLAEAENVKYYKDITNEESMNDALKRLQKDGTAETNRWFNQKSENATADDVAEGWILLKQYSDNKDYDNMVEVAKKMREIGTKAGQTVQAFNIMSRLTPEGMVKYAQSELTDAYNQMVKNKSREWINKNMKDFDLTPGDVEFIMNTMEKVQTMEDGYEKRVELAKIQKLMTDKIPSNAGNKIKAWMRISMLFNPKTQVRNVVGNAIMFPVNYFSDIVSNYADKKIQKQTGVRTTGTYNIKAMIKGMKEGAYQATNDYKLGINTKNMDGNRFEIGEGKSFSEKNAVGRTLNRTESMLNYVMDAGDRVFSQAVFENSLANQLALNKTTEITQEMIDIATTESLQRTWNDNNNYTKFVLDVRKMLNRLLNFKGYGLGDVLVPFAKTPANLTKAIVDYSPVGLVSTLNQYVKLKNNISTGTATSQQQHQFVQSLGKATAGSMLYIIAYALAKAGIANGASDDDKDTANFLKNTLGISSYSIKIGGKSFTYDWAQPIAAPLSIMTNITDKSEETTLYEAIIGNLDSAASVLMEQSFLESINDVLNGYGGTVDNLMQQVYELPARAVPTFVKQMADMVDGTQRQTYVKDAPLKTALNKTISKIPFASKTLDPSVDTMGRDIEKYGGKNNIFNVFLNPATVNTENISSAAQEIYNVYKETGDNSVMPKVAPYYINSNNEKVILSTEERTKYQRVAGNIVEENVNNLISDSNYNSLSSEDKASIINDIVNYSYNIARKEALGIDLPSTYNSAYKYSEIGDISDYYLYKDTTNDEDSQTKKEKIAEYLTNSNLSNNQIAYLYGLDYSNETTLNSLVNANIPIKEFIKLNSATITSDYDKNGNTITNSRKKKYISYVNSLNLTIPQKAMLIKMEYSTYNNYNKQIVSYVNKQNLTKFEKASILKKANFDNYDDYLVDYILNMDATNDEMEKMLKNLGFKIRNGKIYN